MILPEYPNKFFSIIAKNASSYLYIGSMEKCPIKSTISKGACRPYKFRATFRLFILKENIAPLKN